jgi:EF-P beta-lysylation protein EpmB
VASVGELLDLLGLPDDAAGGAAGAARAAADFPLKVPRGFVARMRRGDPRDPLLLQVLAAAAEVEPVAGWGHDPLAEAAAQPVPGVLHKYRGRALLVVTGACAVHCRYCFRRHFPYGEENPARDNWQGAVDYLQAHPEVDELILSGGDPLLLDTPHLLRLSERLRQLPQLKRLRLHTRLPVVLPERIDAPLLDWLESLPWQTIMVIHSNHAAELDAGVGAALAHLRRAGITLLNQSVLLRGVNDKEESLVRLSETLFSQGVMPYYLHLLDRVAGAAHFEVEESRAVALLQALRRHLPGYLVPRLVREIEGLPNKQPVPD